MGFFSNFIGNIGLRKITYFNPTVHYPIGFEGAVWIETDKPKEIFDTIPQINIPIKLIALMFSNAEIVVVNEKGEDDATEEFKKLMENPNFVQSMNEFLRNYMEQFLVYGNQFIYANKPTSLIKVPTALWNLSPRYITPILTGKTFDQVEMAGVYKEFEYNENGKVKKYEPKDILFTRVPDLDNPFIGQSPLVSLKFPITNTKLAYEYRNVMLGKRGAHGMISPEAAKDSDGALPFQPKNKEEIIKEHQRTYGIQSGQAPFMISDFPLKFTHFSVPIKDAMVFEEVDANFLTILDSFGVNRNLFKDSSFENQKSGQIQTYQDCIYPKADQFAQDLTKFLGKGISKSGKGKIKLKYDHLLILQNDKDKEASTLDKQIKAVMQLYDKNILNKKGAVEMLISISGIDIKNVSEESALDVLNRMSALVANNVIQQGLIDEIRALIGWGTINGGQQRPVAANAQFNVQTFGAQ